MKDRKVVRYPADIALTRVVSVEGGYTDRAKLHTVSECWSIND